MKFLVRDSRSRRLKAAGIPVGRYIKFYQGSNNPFDYVPHYDNARPGHEMFLDFEQEPDCTLGSAIYVVKKDFYLTHIKNMFDSSD
jgi:hypothetical protein